MHFAVLSVPVLAIWMLFVADKLRTPLYSSTFLVYVLWLNTRDAGSCHTGERYVTTMSWIRDSVWARHVASYFPVILHREGFPPDPQGNYVFGYHPHARIGIGALCNFATNATGFKDLFPDLDLRVLTWELSFRVPILR